MSIFKVELKKVVDDSYEIETGFSLGKKIVQDIQDGLVGNIQKFAIITDSIVRDLYAQPICRADGKSRLSGRNLFVSCRREE